MRHFIDWYPERIMTGVLCTSRATFPDGVHQCAKDDSHINEGVWHQNEARDRRWSLDVRADGEPVLGMVKP